MFVQIIKSITSKQIFRKHSEIKKMFQEGHFFRHQKH